MMKVALIATDNEFSTFGRCIMQIPDLEWIGSFVCWSGDSPASVLSPDLPPLFSSADLLIEKADTVLIAGAAEERFDHISHALRKGKAVWALWPIAGSVRECVKLASLADEACVVNHAARLGLANPLYRAVLPYIGNVRAVRTEIAKTEAEGDAGTFLLKEFLPYLDRVMEAVDSPVGKVQCKTFAFGPTGFARCRILLSFHSGAEAEFWIDRFSESACGKMRFMGSDFQVDLDFPHSNILICRRDSDGLLQKTEPEWERVGPLRFDLSNFFEGMRTERPEKFTFAESVKVQEVFSEILKQVEKHA